MNLIHIALLRQKAHSLFVENLKADEKQIRFDIFERAAIDPTNIAPMLEKFEGRMIFKTIGKPYFVYNITDSQKNQLLDITGEVLDNMRILTEGE